MMEQSIRIYNNIKELADAFAGILIADINNLPEEEYFFMALSGGSTPGRIFQHLATDFNEKINWQKIKLFWGDERCVGPENEDSNYKMAKKNLLDSVPIPSTNIFRIKGEADPETEALNYEAVVKQTLPSRSNTPQFNIIMLGLGDDGHTASIFPENIELFISDRLFLKSVNPYNKQIRISATGKLINYAKKVIFLVTGESKAEKIAQITHRKPGWEKLPASLVQPVNGDLIWLLDIAAAKKLKND